VGSSSSTSTSLCASDEEEIKSIGSEHHRTNFDYDGGYVAVSDFTNDNLVEEKLWTEYWSDKHGCNYYHNRITGVVQWRNPNDIQEDEVDENDDDFAPMVDYSKGNLLACNTAKENGNDLSGTTLAHVRKLKLQQKESRKKIRGRLRTAAVVLPVGVICLKSWNSARRGSMQDSARTIRSETNSLAKFDASAINQIHDFHVTNNVLEPISNIHFGGKLILPVPSDQLPVPEKKNYHDRVERVFDGIPSTAHPESNSTITGHQRFFSNSSFISINSHFLPGNSAAQSLDLRLADIEMRLDHVLKVMKDLENKVSDNLLEIFVREQMKQAPVAGLDLDSLTLSCDQFFSSDQAYCLQACRSHVITHRDHKMSFSDQKRASVFEDDIPMKSNTDAVDAIRSDAFEPELSTSENTTGGKSPSRDYDLQVLLQLATDMMLF